MTVENRNQQSKRQAVTVLKKLLGSLELEVMEFMWQVGEATVRQVTEVVNHRRPIVYTTVMTVMGHLVGKELLTRTMEGRRYRYRVAQSKNQFMHGVSKHMIRTLVDDFGDLAITQFLDEIGNIVADRLAEFRSQD